MKQVFWQNGYYIGVNDGSCGNGGSGSTTIIREDSLTKVEQTSLNVTLNPGTLNIWSSPVSGTMNIQLADNNSIKEYVLQFKVKDTLTLNLPAGLLWLDGTPLEYEAGKTYAISIVNKLIAGGEFE